MADLDLSVTLSRTLLGLAPLEVNDHTASYVAAESLSGGISWTRQQVSSPFVDGQVTVSRTRAMTSRPLALEVLGADAAELAANAKVIADALSQDCFTLTVTLDGQSYAWAAEAADWTETWTNARWAARQLQLSAQLPCQPVELSGAH